MKSISESLNCTLQDFGVKQSATTSIPHRTMGSVLLQHLKMYNHLITMSRTHRTLWWMWCNQ